MSDNHAHAMTHGDIAPSSRRWKLVVDFSAAKNEDDSFAYKCALKKASTLQNQVMIRTTTKNNKTFWEVWEFK